MGKLTSHFSFASLIIFSLGACSHGQCNNTPQRPTDAAVAAANNQANAETPATPTPSPTPAPNTVQVYKATGGKQCEADKGISLETMKQTLVKNKINVTEAHTQNDGLMHPQVCGAANGEIHIFTIPKNKLKKAMALGFKAWTKS